MKNFTIEQFVELIKSMSDTDLVSFIETNEFSPSLLEIAISEHGDRVSKHMFKYSNRKFYA